MATPPSDVRTALVAVGAAGAAELVAEVAQDPSIEYLLRAGPAVVERWLDASAELALEWYDELRAGVPGAAFRPTPVTNLRESAIGDSIGWALRTSERDAAELALDADEQARLLLDRLLPSVEREISSGFWDTTVENVLRDPEAVGWQRFARPGACPFCRMCADKGAVYRSDTATFAAHKNCKCVARAVFKADDYGPEANAEQYLASKKRRSPEQQARLKRYLHEHFGAPKPRPMRTHTPADTARSLEAGLRKNAPRLDALNGLLAGLGT